ncbi:MAG: spondin domain-containing protein [Granulosicoccus sp.]
MKTHNPITRKSITLLAGAMILGTSAMAQASNYHREFRFSVTITNITKAVQFTPIAAATHNRGIALFELGEAASTPLADVAESGDTTALIAELNNSNAVAGVASTEGLLQPGASTTFEITTARRNNLFSMAAMLLPTNDTFVALNSVQLPRRGSRTYLAEAYDAGSEPNDEICANIPGPFCGGEGRSLDDSNAEGFVHIANGIHGIANVPEQTYDWRSAVAEVTITRLR